MNHDELKSLLSAYSLGAVDDEEKKQLEDHLLHGCPECEAFLEDMNSIAAGLAFSVEPQTPPPALKERILQAVREEQKGTVLSGVKDQINETLLSLQEAKARWMKIGLSLAFATVVAVAGLGWYANSLKKQINFLENQIVMSDRIIGDLRTELVEQERIIKVVRSPDIRIAQLKGLKPSPSSSAKVLWNPEENKAVFYAFDLPQTPSDKDYQLWMLPRGNQPPIDAGTFTIEANGGASYAFDTISDRANLTGFAVTLERKGGAPGPEGEMYLLGTLN